MPRCSGRGLPSDGCNSVELRAQFLSGGVGLLEPSAWSFPKPTLSSDGTCSFNDGALEWEVADQLLAIWFVRA